MEMIDLSRLEPQETLNHTSKGNQLKWKCLHSTFYYSVASFPIFEMAVGNA